MAKKDQKKKDEEATGEEYTGPMAKYKVIGEIFPLNEDGSKKDTPLEMGSIHELPTAAGDQMVEEGTMEVVPDEVPEEKEVAVELAPEKKLYYRGVLIVTPITDVIHHGHPYKEFSIETKETLKLSPGEFAADVTEEK